MKPIKKPARRAYGKANDGTPVVSVTTVLGQTLGWSKDALMFYAAREAASEAVRMKNRGLTDEECIRLGKMAHVAKRDAAADAGKTAHAMIEAYLTGGDPEEAVDPFSPAEVVERARSAYRKFVTWWETAGYTVVHTEVMYVDRETGYGGTADLILRAPDGALVVADVKTGKGIYDEVAIQLAAYATLARQNALPVTRGLVIHVPVDGEMRTHDVPTLVLDRMATAFAALLLVHKSRKLITLEKEAA